MSETSKADARPVMAYSPGEADDVHRVLRGIFAAGVMHGAACLLYVGQRGARWAAGTEHQLENTKTPIAAGLALIVQIVASAALIACCLVCIRRPGDRWLRATMFVGALLATLWFAYGITDSWPAYFYGETQGYTTRIKIELALDDLFRETNQAIVPLLLIFTCRRNRSGRSLALATRIAVIVSCFLLFAPSLARLIALEQVPFALNSAYYLRVWIVGAAFLVAGLMLLALRWPWRLICALPLALYAAKTYFVDGVPSYEDLTTPPSFESMMVNARQMSFFLVVAGPSIAAFAVFSVMKIRPPRWRAAEG